MRPGDLAELARRTAEHLTGRWYARGGAAALAYSDLLSLSEYCKTPQGSREKSRERSYGREFGAGAVPRRAGDVKIIRTAKRMYIDTHAHLNYEDKYGDTDALLAEIAAAGVDTVINVGWNCDSSTLAAKQAEKYPQLYFAAGFHPSNLSDFREGDYERIAALLASPKGVAVGEIGLDYHYDGTDEAGAEARLCRSSSNWHMP